MSAILGWLAVASVTAAALVGIYLRRARRAPPLVVRMRPHFVLGYAALGCSLLHVMFSVSNMGAMEVTGLRAATAATFALGAQTFVGASLQDPGSYRRPLRMWHLILIAIFTLTVLVHVIANGAL